jgi:hypothetical protein
LILRPLVFGGIAVFAPLLAPFRSEAQAPYPVKGTFVRFRDDLGNTFCTPGVTTCKIPFPFGTDTSSPPTR